MHLPKLEHLILAEMALVIFMKSCLYSQKPLQVECTKDEFYWKWDVLKVLQKWSLMNAGRLLRVLADGGFTESSCTVNL